ncbi:methylmalonic aciduria type A homolog, mitochondrial-like [Lytechinus variegatus]|uniref:methylmalonic aciduria type A homolog, mitochondrial-like n=1 Tax=Lytechinus variegatus TaxID=7654 RepID=UPI001BB14879|nr:methylmalonic aciduria type A homolog, mitochondrial-like [Lytechinus variegatus]
MRALFKRLKSIDHWKMAAICRSCQINLRNSFLQSSSTVRCVQTIQSDSLDRVHQGLIHEGNVNRLNGPSFCIPRRDFSTSLPFHQELLTARKNFKSSVLFLVPHSVTFRLSSSWVKSFREKSTQHLSRSSGDHLHELINKYCTQSVLEDDVKREESYAHDLSKALLTGERWALARAITLVEATHKKGKRQAQILLRTVLDHLREVQLKNRGIPPSFRIGLTGPPGAGKSTFIEAMGKKLTSEGHRVAVLAVDPSSSITGGSLLGDKTRMTELSRDPNAYIRASPSAGTLGGVTRNTNDTILLCEAAGYDVIIVETIGVGQSEYVVADMVDMLVLLIPPAGGDELQGLKKGIVERADFILINKADGELLIPARRMRSEYTSAVKLMYKRSSLWSPKVKQVSSKTGDGLSKAWDTMEEYRGIMTESGEFITKRQRQRRVWMWQHIKDRMMEEFKDNQDLRSHIKHWEEEVMAGRSTSGIAADNLLNTFSKLSRNFKS